MSDAIKSKILKIIAEQALLEVSDIDETAPLASLGIDSLGLVEAIFAIEEAYDIAIPFNANDTGPADFDLTSVASIIEAVKGLVAKNAA